MKHNKLKTMEKLKIDKSIRGLISQLWKHCYQTVVSCQGGGKDHNDKAFVSYTGGSGDGWFEKNAEKYGLEKMNNSQCCINYNNLYKKIGIIPIFCNECGAGMNGNIVYEGNLIENSFQGKIKINFRETEPL